jgi:site-specific DNA-methyltransferase (adenine-specific)
MRGVEAAAADAGLEPYVETERGKLYAADMRDVLRAQADASVDLVFGDPPFNLKKDYGGGAEADDLPLDAYLAWCWEWVREGVRVLKPGGTFWLYNIPRHMVHLAGFLEAHELEFRHWIAVAVTNQAGGRVKTLYPAHYALVGYSKGTPRVTRRIRVPFERCRHCGGLVKDYGGHLKDFPDQATTLKDVWTDCPPVFHAKFKGGRRQNTLSLKFAARVLRLATDPGDLVLDLFSGAGPFPVACEKLGRRWVAAELYDYEVIAARLALAVDPQGLGTDLVDDAAVATGAGRSGASPR